MCFAKHTHSKSNLGPLGLRPRPAHSSSFFTGLDWARSYGLGRIQLAWPGYWFRPVTRLQTEARVKRACMGGGGKLKFKVNSPRWINIEREKEEDLPVLETEPQTLTYRLDDASPVLFSFPFSRSLLLRFCVFVWLMGLTRRAEVSGSWSPLFLSSSSSFLYVFFSPPLCLWFCLYLL